MKNIDKILLFPLLAAFAVGCSAPTSMQSSEFDDVYFTSKDKTIIQDKYVVAANQAATQSSAQGAAAGTSTDNNTVQNPEYSGRTGNNTSSNSQDYYSANYNNNDYYYASQLSRFHTPYIGRSYFDYGYTSNFWYNPRFLGSTFYDPFYGYGGYSYYDPFFYPSYPGFGWGYPRYASSINIMFGRPYGYGFGGLGYGMGYGLGFGNPYYGGYNRYYNNYANGGYGNGDNARRVQYGPRTDRSTVPGAGGGVNTGMRPRGDVGAPDAGGLASPSGNGIRNGRRGTTVNDNVINQSQGVVSDPSLGGVEGINRNSRGRRLDNINTAPAGVDVNQLPNGGNVERMDRGRRGRLQEILSAPSNQSDNVNTAPAQVDREYRTRRMEQPTYQSQPRQERSREIYRSEPSYQAPARTRSYEMPSSQPNYNSGSDFGGGRSSGGFGGGGGFNGGGGGGGGRRGR